MTYDALTPIHDTSSKFVPATTKAGVLPTIVVKQTSFGWIEVVDAFIRFPHSHLDAGYTDYQGKVAETQARVLGQFRRESKTASALAWSGENTTAKEGVYFALPVVVSTPTFAYAPQQGWLDPARDLMKGAGLEWFRLQHWMVVYDPALSVGVVPPDAPLASFGDINRGKWPERFSYVMNNYWDTNYRAGQGGDFVFRYAVTSAAKLDGDALTRLAIDEMGQPNSIMW